MTPYVNVTITSTTSAEGNSRISLLWLPYVIIAAVCVGMLAINFYCYHRKHRERYMRNAEVIKTRERVMERRLIWEMVKARYMTQCEDDSDDYSTGSGTVLAQTHEFNRNSKYGVAHL